MKGLLAVRIVAWGIALTLVALPVIGVLNGWFAVDRWPVRYLQVEAEYNHVSAEQIRAAAASHLGTGFFALNLDDVRAAVVSLPWVENVEVRKQWPDTLILHVRERQPFARWGDKRLIGRDGTLFSVPGGEMLQGLPQLDGPDDALTQVIDFYNRTLQAFAGSGMVLSGVHFSERGSWSLTLVGGAQVYLGHQDTERRLQRFLAVYPLIAAGHAGGFQHADLRYTNGFAVQWMTAGPAAPDKPMAAPAGAETHS